MIIKNLSAALLLASMVACSSRGDAETSDMLTSGGINVGESQTGGGSPTTADDNDDADDEPKLDVGGAEDDDGGPGTMDCDGLTATIRDFQSSHPDFQSYAGMMAYTGLVLPELGPDGTPQYNPEYDGPTMITSAATFADWYHDVPGVNQSFQVELPLFAGDDGTYSFDSNAFFPIDGQGFGNEDNPNNFHFTTEVRTTFTYKGGETFTFRGDDDIWVFIDGQLAIDLGGLHSALEATIQMDALGLVVGETYDMDIFHAERHTDESNFRIVTTIDCFIEPIG